MKDRPATGTSRALEYAAVLARLVLGALFLYMGLKKAMAPAAFLKLIRQYDMVHTPFLLNAIGAVLPWFEAFCGVLLLTGIAVRGAALTIIAELIPFTWLVYRRALVLQSLKAIPFCAVKFDCGCGAGEVYICHKLTENIVLILLACWLVCGAGKLCSVRYSLFPKESSPHEEHEPQTAEEI